MRSGSPSPHFGGDPNRFHYFLRRRSLPHGAGGVRTDAIRALGDVGNSHRDQLLRTRGKRALGEYTAAEGAKGSRRPGSQAGALFRWEADRGDRVAALAFSFLGWVGSVAFRTDSQSLRNCAIPEVVSG